MRTLQKTNTNKTSPFREKRNQVLDKAILLLRPDNLPQLLRPIRNFIQGSKCVISKRSIEVGDYVYPCYENPVRLAPGGPVRCHLDEALKISDHILPVGYVAIKIPTPETLFNEARMRKNEMIRRRTLNQLGTQLLKSGSKYIKANNETDRT